VQRGGEALDYSENSLRIVNAMLDEANQYLAELPPPQQDGLVNSLASYILEVAKRARGGKFYWHDGREKPVLVVGEPRFRIALLPWDQVRGRLTGDASCDIPFYYEGFRGRVAKAVEGDDALYV
jgi:hypothetical protein